MSVTIATHKRYACAAIVRAEKEVLGVVLWGGHAGAFQDLSILRIHLRLFDHCLPKSQVTADRKKKLAHAAPSKFPQGYFIGQSEASVRLHCEVQTLSPCNLPILLVGETGVGKEHIARLLHSWSDRAEFPFIAINCAAIPAELLEAEMSGIGRRATGVQEREGYFQLAQGGTLFLDEIGEHVAASSGKAVARSPRERDSPGRWLNVAD